MTNSAAAARRVRASQLLDRHWPVARGVTIGQDSARAFVLAAFDGLMYERDWAGQDARLLELVGGGLLELAERDLRAPAEKQYRRPLTDFDWDAHEAAGPPPVMWNPADGSEPRPYADVLAEQAARREQEQIPTTAGTTFDE